jgi:hypothetical protein
MSTKTVKADAPEIELSPAAIGAGLGVLLESGALYYETESHRPLVEDIIRTSLLNAGYRLQIVKDQLRAA